VSRQACFPKEARLRKRPEFLRVQDRGEKVAQGPLVILALRSPSGSSRLGVTVSSKVGNAVTRVRIRRHVREFYRQHRGEFPEGVDVVVIARGSAKQASGASLRAALQALLPHLNRRFPK